MTPVLPSQEPRSGPGVSGTPDGGVSRPYGAHSAPETTTLPAPALAKRTPTVRRGLTVAYDKLHEAVTLNLGESEIYRWPIPTDDRDKDLNAQWRLERFVAQRLGRLIDLAERFRDDEGTP